MRGSECRARCLNHGISTIGIRLASLEQVDRSALKRKTDGREETNAINFQRSAVVKRINNACRSSKRNLDDVCIRRHQISCARTEVRSCKISCAYKCEVI